MLSKNIGYIFLLFEIETLKSKENSNIAPANPVKYSCHPRQFFCQKDLSLETRKKGDRGGEKQQKQLLDLAAAGSMTLYISYIVLSEFRNLPTSI